MSIAGAIIVETKRGVRMAAINLTLAVGLLSRSFEIASKKSAGTDTSLASTIATRGIRVRRRSFCFA